VIICKPQIKKNNCFCFSKKKIKILSEFQKNKVISQFLYDNKFPKYIDDILQLYRNRNTLTTEYIRQHSRSNEMFLIIKYTNKHFTTNNEKVDKMPFNDKIDLIRQILYDIEQI
jgi:hypothetical protein